MTEQEWRTATEAAPMLAFLHRDGRASERKLRLFACARCRQFWKRLTAETSRRVVELAERFADGAVEASTVGATATAAGDVADAMEQARAPYWHHAFTAYMTAAPAELAAEVAVNSAGANGHLLRDIFGPLPFRAVAADPAWLAWNGGAVRRLAQAAYDERALPAGTFDPGRLAVLADALEESGCTASELLDHLRGPGPHVRGCWAVDLLLGKN